MFEGVCMCEGVYRRRVCIIEDNTDTTHTHYFQNTITIHIQNSYTTQGKEVDIVLLDGRWDRDDLPCAVRRQW